MSHESALISLRRVPVAASGAGASGGLSGFLSSVLSRISNLPPVVTSLVSKATPYASWAGDLTWAVASSAVLLAIPIVVEIQRETTVRVMQKQREMETQQIQEQTLQSQGGLLQTVQGLGSLLSGGPSSPSPNS